MKDYYNMLRHCKTLATLRSMSNNDRRHVKKNVFTFVKKKKLQVQIELVILNRHFPILENIHVS